MLDLAVISRGWFECVYTWYGHSQSLYVTTQCNTSVHVTNSHVNSI